MRGDVTVRITANLHFGDTRRRTPWWQHVGSFVLSVGRWLWRLYSLLKALGLRHL
jgi:hypothetical protein